jgi:hypothetical protein
MSNIRHNLTHEKRSAYIIFNVYPSHFLAGWIISASSFSVYLVTSSDVVSTILLRSSEERLFFFVVFEGYFVGRRATLGGFNFRFFKLQTGFN